MERKIKQQQFFDKFVQEKGFQRLQMPSPLRVLSNFCYVNFIQDLVGFLDKSSGQLVLDLGCGDGGYSRLAASRRSDAYGFGVDISSLNLRQANKLSENLKPRLSFIACDVGHLPFQDETFDTVLAIAIIHHSGLGTLWELKRVLKKRGYLFMNEIVLNNPLIFFGRKIFFLVPRCIKKLMFDVGPAGEIPPIFLFTTSMLSTCLRSLDFTLIKEERESLFIFVFNYFFLFPLTRFVISTRVLLSISRFERFLIKHTPTRALCHIVRLWCVLDEDDHL